MGRAGRDKRTFASMARDCESRRAGDVRRGCCDDVELDVHWKYYSVLIMDVVERKTRCRSKQKPGWRRETGQNRLKKSLPWDVEEQWASYA
jgi:hypothetical protein